LPYSNSLIFFPHRGWGYLRLRRLGTKLGTRLGISLGIWAIVFGTSLPVWAADQPGAISGYVRSVSGVPQMGAVVENKNKHRKKVKKH